MYDVIVIGARVAGASTAMLLARRGLDVLLVDRAAFPSDTLSTHQVQLPGVARLRRWGLLDALDAAGTPPARRVRYDAGDAVLDGCFPEHDGVDAVYSPRRGPSSGCSWRRSPAVPTKSAGSSACSPGRFHPLTTSRRGTCSG
jgi:2-polyprenyl-6-methoxyphenol hydroxylase-like FAD-dependent oxidoreductase